jgi:hypothetical protein
MGGCLAAHPLTRIAISYPKPNRAALFFRREK